jgi:hypothetical protein
VYPSYNVSSIGYGGFAECYSLIIYVGYANAASKPGGWLTGWNFSGSPIYYGINASTYYKDGQGLEYVIVAGKAVVARYTESGASVIIPASITIGANSYNVTSIGDLAFYGCSSLESIVISAGITSIGNYAFYDCNSVTTVYYGGADSTAWSGITIGSNNTPLTNATRYYYSETESAGKWHYVNGVPTLWA